MNDIIKQDNKVVVSVIIPCYNSEKNILTTIKSLENQVYKDFEVIIINDGSIDKSDEIITEYLKKSKLKHKYLKQKNAGVSAARNKGIENANGKYITFLDSDDIYHREYLEILVNVMENESIDTAYCSYSRDISSILKGKEENKININYLQHNELMRNFMYRKGPCGFFNYIYKQSIIEEYNIRFDENTKYGEDLEFIWKYLSNCNNGVFIEQHLYGYYDNPDSAVNNTNWRITDVLSVIKRLEEYMYENNEIFFYEFKSYMYDRTVWSILKDFAINKQNKLFEKFIETYQTKKSMKNMIIKGPHVLIKFTAALFLLNPKIFYRVTKKYR